MKFQPSRIVFPLLIVGAIVAFFWLKGGRMEHPEDVFSGYAEGELVYVAAPIGGELEELNVKRGDQAAKDAVLFTLERKKEEAQRTEAQEMLAESKTTLEKTTLDFNRAKSLRDKRVTSPEDYDTARQALLAAQHTSAARQHALEQADWQYAQKQQTAPEAGLVYDTYHRAGEWVAAGVPVLSLLPPEYMKVRFFVPETALGKIQPGTPVRIFMDGLKDPLPGKISYVSPKAEYTLPVIYSRENRSKLVFLVEAGLAPEQARLLHPGAPVEVHLDASER